jgi:predicted exporter
MANLLAATLSTVLAYAVVILFGQWLSDMGQLIVSSIVGLVSFAFLKWWLQRLRGD